MNAGTKKTAAQRTVDDDTAVELWGRVIRGFEATNGRVHAAIKAAFSLNPAEAQTMLQLGGDPRRRAPMNTLARAASFTSGGFTKIADKLENRGLAVRTACAEDRRVTYLELTPAGVEIAAELRCLVADINRSQFVAVLGAERATLVADAMLELYGANGTSGA
ncbi:MarR family winged helix-turn-helix transcriptional regulator [Georgenia daeguensis]|uniref:MarR family transcriptional regulator n=1 Tax=Georgenia daeguensis TaxID=908355 RepID=A0ABP8EXX4_9MICO